MKKLVLPDNYSSVLNRVDTQKAIKYVKDSFQKVFSEKMYLDRITAPIIVKKDTGINDDLNGVERKVSFDLMNMDGTIEIVQSLAKWKRMALYKYGYAVHSGIYTDMLAIRRDDDLDNTHSVYVDQWDWERVISADDRNINYLQNTVKTIVSVIADVKDDLRKLYPDLKYSVNRDVKFITSQELEDEYTDLSPKEREKMICKKYGTVFIEKIGCKLKSGNKHDLRAPDYDDWNLNGDIMVWDDVLDDALELSSMGIRVDSDSLKNQLRETGTENRLSFDYHKMIVEKILPLTIGGGIGQSRICMFLLEKAHVGEVQVSVWPDSDIKKLAEHKIYLL